MDTHFTFICALLFSFQVVVVYSALTDEEIKADFMKTMLGCAKKFNPDMQELMALATLKPPKDKEVKCTLACAYREKGTMDDKGMYDLEGSRKFAHKNLKGDDDRLKKGLELADLCNKVNDEKVSDGEKGCERAALMFKCSVENAPKFGFKL